MRDQVVAKIDIFIFVSDGAYQLQRCDCKRHAAP